MSRYSATSVIQKPSSLSSTSKECLRSKSAVDIRPTYVKITCRLSSLNNPPKSKRNRARLTVSFNSTVIAVGAETPKDGNLASGFCVLPLCTNGKDTRSRLQSLSVEEKCYLYRTRSDLQPSTFKESKIKPRKLSSSLSAPFSSPISPSEVLFQTNVRDSLEQNTSDILSFVDMSYEAYLNDMQWSDNDSEDEENSMPIMALRDSLDFKQLRASSHDLSDNQLQFLSM